MDEWMDKWTDEWMDDVYMYTLMEWIKEWKDEWMNGWMGLLIFMENGHLGRGGKMITTFAVSSLNSRLLSHNKAKSTGHFSQCGQWTDSIRVQHPLRNWRVSSKVISPILYFITPSRPAPYRWNIHLTESPPLDSVSFHFIQYAVLERSTKKSKILSGDPARRNTRSCIRLNIFLPHSEINPHKCQLLPQRTVGNILREPLATKRARQVVSTPGERYQKTGGAKIGSAKKEAGRWEYGKGLWMGKGVGVGARPSHRLIIPLWSHKLKLQSRLLTTIHDKTL